MKSLSALPSLCAALALMCAACATAEPLSLPNDAPTIRYACDGDGLKLVDSGALGVHGRLASSPRGSIMDIEVRAGKWDAWLPILRDGAQIKNIAPGSDMATTGGDIPIVLHRNTDYKIDYAKGRIMALGSGNIEHGSDILLQVSYENPGPGRVPRDKGKEDKALQFDGIDDYVQCGAATEMRTLSAVSFELRFRPSEHMGESAMLLRKGNGLSLGFQEGRIVFTHKGLKQGKEKAVETLSTDPVTLDARTWHHVRAVWDGQTVEIVLDRKTVARREGVTGILRAKAPLRMGGEIDPHFFSGEMDDITIRFTAVDRTE